MEKGEASNWTKRKFRDAVEAITHGVGLSTAETLTADWWKYKSWELPSHGDIGHREATVFNACTQINTSALAPLWFVISQSWWSLVSLSHWVPLSVVLLDYKNLITITGSEKICFYPRYVCLFYLVIQRNTCHPCSPPWLDQSQCGVACGYLAAYAGCCVPGGGRFLRLFLGPAALTAVCVLALLTRESTRKRSITCRTINTTPHVNERKLCI